MENKILETLNLINDKLTSIDKKLGILCKEPNKENSNKKSEEDEVMEFLKGLTEELGLKDRVTIRKVEIK